MKTWICSDLHLGHHNIIKYCPNTRGHFRDADHMDREIVYMWNSQVAADDLVYILGDVAFANTGKAITYLSMMNGSKILIKGNHDSKNLKHPSFRACFTEVHDYLKIDYNGTIVVMFHFPMMSWDQMHFGSVHFYGHLHQHSIPELEKYRARNVGFDFTNKIVMTMEEAIASAMKGEVKPHHT